MMSALPNPRHERFAQLQAKGKTADEAYAEAGFKPHRGNASRMSANESVRARVAALQERAAVKIEVTMETIAKQLDEDRGLAHAEGQAGAAVAASLGKAKLFGLLVDKAKVEATAHVTSEMIDRPPRETREEWLARKARERGEAVT